MKVLGTYTLMRDGSTSQLEMESDRSIYVHHADGDRRLMFVGENYPTDEWAIEAAKRFYNEQRNRDGDTFIGPVTWLL